MQIRKFIALAIGLICFAGVVQTAQSQTRVVVVPLGSDEPNECFIIGKGTECVDDGRISVPIGLVFECDFGRSNPRNIDYKLGFQFVEFSLTASTGELIDIALEDAGDQKIALRLTQQPAGTILFSGETGGISSMPMEICEAPTLDTGAPFTVGDYAWTVTPVFSKTANTVTLKELVFNRTIVPIGPFVADGVAGEAVFISVDTGNDTFSARVGNTNSPFANDGVKFEFHNFDEVEYSSIGNIWNSVSNTGTFDVPGFPPGIEFTSILVGGGKTYELRVQVGESTSATIAVDEITVTPR